VNGFAEVADRVFVLRYPVLDVNVTLIVGDGEALVVDTLSGDGQARELAEALRRITPVPPAVVNTHHHFDHWYGNQTLARDGAGPFWAHQESAHQMKVHGERLRRDLVARFRDNDPELAAEIEAARLLPPTRVVHQGATLDVGGRRVELRHLGRGHTDSDIVIAAAGTGVLFAGDLLENGAPPYFGDAFPLDWPDAVQRMLALVDERTRVVPGHGDPEGRAFVEESLASFRAVADLARRAHAEGLAVDDVLPEAPWGGDPLIRQALERGLAQLRGELDR
jgi:glyoxylase-like metal-dependent hydrolase (beta-lactamase superfamily II)